MNTDSQHARQPGLIRIISDIHWRHPVSIVHRPGQLAPLFEGVDTVVFNGDTVEQRSGTGRDGVLEDAGRIEDVCRYEGAEAVFLSGNHDPEVSSLGFAEFGSGKVLVTHGDILFPEIGIWGSSMPRLKARCENIFRNGTAEVAEPIGGVIDTVRSVCSTLINERNGNSTPRVVPFFLSQGWPPTRALRTIKCWMETSRRGVGLAARHNPGVRFVVMGHTHYPGIWRRNDLTVINTGSFLPPLGRRLVEINGCDLTVRRIVYRRKEFHPGGILGKWTMT